jgi:hypothetical protein
MRRKMGRSGRKRQRGRSSRSRRKALWQRLW